MVGPVDLVDHLKLDQPFNNKEGESRSESGRSAVWASAERAFLQSLPLPSALPESSPFVRHRRPAD